jgi:hypothetical protein
MGPWTHDINNGIAGCSELSNNPELNSNFLLLPFLNHWLKGIKNEISGAAAVNYWEMNSLNNCGKGMWHRSDSFPQTETLSLFLNINNTLGDLTQADENTLGFTYDPRSPWMTTGGNTLSLDAGPRDVSGELKKNHHLLFASSPLEKSLRVTGEIKCQLFIKCDVPSSDIVPILVDIMPDNQKIILLDGIQRIKWSADSSFNLPVTAPSACVQISLGWTSYIFQPGHRIGLIITGGNWPKHERNPQNGKIHFSEDRAHSACYTVFTGKDKASCLLLPVVEGT